MASANSAGGVMGKMIAAPSMVVASTATQTYGQEGTILRFVFFHSLALAALVWNCGLPDDLCAPLHRAGGTIRSTFVLSVIVHDPH